MNDEKNEVTKSHVPTQKHLYVYTSFLAILLIAAGYNYGPYVFFIAITAYAVALPIELLFARYRKRDLDKSWMVTPLVITLLMPPSIPLWIVGVASGFGIFFGKAIFGGLGKNVFNPALVGVLFVTISFSPFMISQWFNPEDADMLLPSTEEIGYSNATDDVITSATPLISMNASDDSYEYRTIDLLFGNVSGTLGETFRVGILILGVGLLLLKVADWRIPTALIGTVFFATFLGKLLLPNAFPDPVVTFLDGGVFFDALSVAFMSLLVGGVLFGAFFIATDPVTAPRKQWAKVFYAIGIGLLVVLIRNFATFAEGLVFAIIIMNAVAPLLDQWNDTTTVETEGA